MEAWKWAPEERGIVEDSLEEVRARMERQKEVGRKKGEALCREGPAEVRAAWCWWTTQSSRVQPKQKKFQTRM